MRELNFRVIVKINRYKFADLTEQQSILKEITTRLRKIVKCNNEIFERIDQFSTQFEKENSSFHEDEKNIDQFEDECIKIRNECFRKYQIPKSIWNLNAADKINADWISDAEKLIENWIYGICHDYTSTELYVKLDEDYDLDVHYIIFGFPNHSIKKENHELLHDEFLRIGKRNIKKSN